VTGPRALVPGDAASEAGAGAPIDVPADTSSDTPTRTPTDTPTNTPLGIICGSGTVPYAVADAVMGRGRRVVLFPLRGWADAAAVEAYPHHWMWLGQFGRIFRFARREGCRDLVFVGGVIRPSILQLRLDWGTVMQMPLVIRSFRGGDDHLLSGVGRLFEGGGFRVLGAHEVAPEITAPTGVLGRHRPDADIDSDIDRGFALLAATSAFDIGQAAVIAGRRVLAIEAAEGTDAMLERVAMLREAGRIRHTGRVGVLVKAPKRRQDRRFDLPSIGPGTVVGAARAGLAGIAVIAGATIVAEPQQSIEAADRAGLFVVGRPDPEAQA
jgi:UDP-2,3-diacylglucosamine hydrolase